MKEDKLKKYLKKKYYKDDRKVIAINVEREEDLYNNLDGLKDTLNDEVTEYLKRSVETILPLNKVTIAVNCKGKIDLENLKRCIKIHYGVENLNFARIERLANRKKHFLLFVALATLLSFIIDYSSLLEIRNFILTLAIWEYIDIILGHDEEDDIEMYVTKVLEDAEVIEQTRPKRRINDSK